MNEKNSAPVRDARTLGIPKMMLLGLQHMFAMFGATVLVPIIVSGYGLPLSFGRRGGCWPSVSGAGAAFQGGGTL